MKISKKTWKRYISLLLCFIMTAKLFAGIGLEVEAASYKIVLYKATSGITFTDGSWINQDIDMKIYDNTGKSQHISWKAGSGATTDLESINRIEFLDNDYFKSDGIDTTHYYIHPEYNTHMQHSIIVWPACKLNITVVDHENKPVPNQTVNVKWSGDDYGSVTTDSQGKATHWKVRHIASGVTISTNYDGRTHSVKTGHLGDSYDVTLKIPKLKTVSVNLKNAGGELLKNACVRSGDIIFSDSDNNGTYTADLEVGKNYTIGADADGYDTKSVSTGVITENTSAINMTLDASAPVVYPSANAIQLTVGKIYSISRIQLPNMQIQGITYTSEVDNPSVASYDGSVVTGLKEGTANLHFHAVTGNVKRTTTIPITVKKANPTATVTPPTSIVYGDYKGEFTFRSSVDGTFVMNGKNIEVQANTDIKKKATEIISGNPVVGTHSLEWKFVPTEKEKYNEQSGTLNYTVGAKDITNVGNLSFADENFVYDGTAQKVKNIKVTVGSKELVENTDYTISYKDNINAGKATVTVTGKGNYAGKVSKNFDIQKAMLSIDKVTAENRQYNGEKTVKIKDVVFVGISANVVDLSNAKADVSDKNVGTYTNVTNVSGIHLTDTNNYVLTMPEKNTVISLTNGVTISPKQVTIQNVVIEDKKVYDGGTAAKITEEGEPSVNYDGDALYVVKGKADYSDKNVGKGKTVVFDGFELAGEEASNYVLTAQPASQTAEITKKPLHLVTDSANVKDKYFDGTLKAEFEGTPTLVENDLVSNDEVSLDFSAAPLFNDSGSPDEEQTVKVTTNLKLVGTDALNYDLQIPDVFATIKNYTAEKGKDYIVNSNDWTNQDFVIDAAEGCEVARDMNSSWTFRIIVSCSDNDAKIGVQEFYVKYPDGKISKVVKESYKIDKIAPSGTVTFTEADEEWATFVNPSSFDLYYNDAQEVVITAKDQDELSGVASVEWYESMSGGLTLEDVADINEWHAYEGNLVVALEDAKKFVYYVKITDVAGNVTYLSTDGAVYDTTNPAIARIENDKIYYTTQQVSIFDTNLKEVTWNGTPVTMNDGVARPIILEGNKEATYTIAAVDKAGNETTVTVTMKTIASITETIKDLTEDNVTGDDTETLKAVEDVLLNVDDEFATEEEKQALKDAHDQVDNLQKVIEETANDVKELNDSLAEYNKDSVTSQDEEEIDQLIADIENTLKDDNLSNQQKADLEKALEDAKALANTIDDARETLSNTKDSVKDIDADNILLTDEEVLENAKQTLEDIVSDENGNYTKEEKEAAQTELDKVNTLIRTIDNVNGVILKNDSVKQIMDTIKKVSEIPDNKELVEKAVEAKQAYEALTEKEKALVGDAIAQQINENYKKAVDFNIIKGADGIYTKESKEGLAFTANGAFGLFKEVKVDGIVLNAKNYIAKAGSTIVELKADYLDTLKEGAYTLEVGYEVLGEAYGAACEFTIEKATDESLVNGTNTPDTGDDTNVFGWLFVMMLSAMAAVFVMTDKRKKRS